MNSVLAVRVFAVILMVVVFGVAIHAPVTIYLSTHFPDWELVIKSWKELLLGLATVILLVEVARRQMFGQFLRDRIIQMLLAYAGLHFVLAALIPNSVSAIGAGLLIDLRYLLFFTLVYCGVRLVPNLRVTFLRVVMVGAGVILGFALLQMFVLPRDILANIGYGPDTIAPYLTVDDNEDYVRINSTLRGPNPLGAYAVIIFAIVVAAATKFGGRLRSDQHLVTGIAVAASCLMLIVSYSRSALLALLIATGAIVAHISGARISKKLVGMCAGILVAVSLLFITFAGNPVVSHIVWHDDPNGGGRVDSNQEHVNSLIDGTERMVSQPFGAGIGSTGSASLLSDKPIVIENQYLFTAHEVGWLGLGLFIWLFVTIMRQLWRARASALALGVFASGLGLAAIGILLPVWVDDTVSIVWWGLAALGVGGWEMGNRKGGKYARKN